MLLKSLSQSRTKPLLLTPSHANLRDEVIRNPNEFTPPNRVLHDLPSWTPLKVQPAGTPESGDDEFLVEKNAGNLGMERRGGQLVTSDGTRTAGGDSHTSATVKRALRTPSPARVSPSPPKKRLRARFDGVFITTKPPSFKQQKRVSPPRKVAASRPGSESSAPQGAAISGSLSLVDALARTFNANKHTEAASSPPASTTTTTYRLSHANRVRRLPRDGASTTHTDVETGTGTGMEGEDEHYELNPRLSARPSSKSHEKRRMTTKAGGTLASRTDPTPVVASGTVSRSTPDIEGREAFGPRLRGSLAGRLHGASLHRPDPEPDRPVKRLKVIQYETNTKWIDAALETVQAPVSWAPERVTVRGVDGGSDDLESPEVTPWKMQTHSPIAVNEDNGLPVISSPAEAHGSRAPTVNVTVTSPQHSRTLSHPEVSVFKREKGGVLSPYMPHGAKFRQRLADAFGADAVVRTDRSARPRSMLFDYDDYYPPLDADDQAPSESTVSSSVVSVANSASVSVPVSTATPEEGGGKSVVESMAITSLPVGDGPAQMRLEDADTANSATTPPVAIDDGDERIQGWIVALQRLVKGKVHVKEEDLETLSIILAEVESVKNSLDSNMPMNSELRQTVQQLSQLYEIPFGDRNKLRVRAEEMLCTWPVIGIPGAS